MKHLIATSLIAGTMMVASGWGEEIQNANTIAIQPGDSPEMIIEKATHVVPTQNQLEALNDGWIAFIHFGPNTFTRREWGSGTEDPKVFDLKTLDTDQWCRAMKAAGMRKVILTVKHHDGFCLWQSRYTKHGIMSTNFQNGKGDILRDLSKSCQKYGLKLGIYLSPADLFQIENPKGLYGNGSKATKRTIPRPVSGRPFNNKTRFEFEVDDYNEYFLNQLFELLTEYGPVHELWFDGAHPKRKGGQQYNYTAWKELIHKLAPKAVIFGREDIRWCGNEAGGTRPVEWNVVPYLFDPETAQHFPDMTAVDLGVRNNLLKGKFLHYQPAEVNTSIREGWFYRDDTHQKVRSADDVFDIYERAVGGNAIFLLNIPPNRDGMFSPDDEQCLVEVGKRIRETYHRDLMKGVQGPHALLDGKLETSVSIPKEGGSIELSFPKPTTINRVVLQEDVARFSERVEDLALDVWANGQWQQVAQAPNIGFKRILRFPDVTTTKIRLRILKTRNSPALAEVSVHYYKSRPPQLQASISANNQITLAPVQHSFGWKPHGHNSAKNLGASEVSIHYSTDGKKATASSPKYSGSFSLAHGMLRAVAVMNGQTGPELKEIVGYAKSDWKALVCSGQADGHAVQAAFDAQENTFWESPASDSRHFIEIDLGQVRKLTGFAYTPQKQDSRGMMERGVVKVSKDGKNWTVLERFEFGNLINDPSRREHRFSKKKQTRYVRVEADSIAGNGRELTIAELSFF